MATGYGSACPSMWPLVETWAMGFNKDMGPDMLLGSNPGLDVTMVSDGKAAWLPR